MVLTVSFVISPVIGLSCHRHQADCGFSNPVGPTKTSARLDAGVEASGPHDFAVRESIFRRTRFPSLTAKPPCNFIARKMLSRPPHPVPRP
jgi:hypothetical protein